MLLCVLLSTCIVLLFDALCVQTHTPKAKEREKERENLLFNRVISFSSSVCVGMCECVFKCSKYHCHFHLLPSSVMKEKAMLLPLMCNTVNNSKFITLFSLSGCVCVCVCETIIVSSAFRIKLIQC